MLIGLRGNQLQWPLARERARGLTVSDYGSERHLHGVHGLGRCLSPERPGNGPAECSDRRSGRNGRELYRVVSKLRLCRATQSAGEPRPQPLSPLRPPAPRRTRRRSKSRWIGSKPSGSPKGFGRSPTMTFPGAVKTSHALSVFVATGGVTGLVSFSPFVPPIRDSFRRQSESDCSKQNWQKRDNESVGRSYRSRPKYWLDAAARKASREHPQPFKSESHPGQPSVNRTSDYSALVRPR